MTTGVIKYLRVAILFFSILDIVIIAVTFANGLSNLWDGILASLFPISIIFASYIYIIKSKFNRPSNGLAITMYFMSIITFALKISLWNRARLTLVDKGLLTFSAFDITNAAPYFTDAIFGSILSCLVPIEVHLSIVLNHELQSEGEGPKSIYV